MTWESLQNQALILYGKYVGSNSFVESDSGSPSDLALLFDMVNQEIAANPGMPEYFKRKVGAEITLTGASTIDLRSEFPDYCGFYQFYGINEYRDQLNVSQSERNILRENQGYTVNNGILYLSDGFPTSGTYKIDYRSSYMVENSSGVRKEFFENDTDVSVLLPIHKRALLMGVGKYVNWKADNASKAQRNFILAEAAVAMETLFLHQEQEESIKDFLL